MSGIERGGHTSRTGRVELRNGSGGQLERGTLIFAAKDSRHSASQCRLLFSKELKGICFHTFSKVLTNRISITLIFLERQVLIDFMNHELISILSRCKIVKQTTPLSI